MIHDLHGRHFDVAIVGGGINGASAAQHLSAAGYSVFLAEQSDFASGTSSRSSRLLHCGLRHLASGAGIGDMLRHPLRLARALATVREDMLARDDIVRSIPERVRAINFCLPVYTGETYAPWHVDAAFASLRMASPKGVPLDYRRYRRDQFDQVPITPWLRNPDDLRALSVFREYIFDWPERIALDALQAARDMGAEVHNYTRVTALNRANPEGAWQLTLRSNAPGAATDTDPSSSEIQINATLVLNLAGAWVDQISATTGQTVAQKCQGIKGIHIAVQLPPQFADWGVFTYNSLGEPLYCLPWRGFHYIGLTRTPYTGDLADVVATDPEIDWMLSETNRVMPKLGLRRADVLYSWAGVNPLTYDAQEPLGSREIKIHDLATQGLEGVFSLTGGAIMTHRRVAKRLVQRVSKRLAPTGPASEMPPKDVVAGGHNQTGLITSPHSQVAVTQVLHSAAQEQPLSLADLMMRRLGVGWDSDQGLAIARPVAEVAAPILGWDKPKTEAEIQAYSDHLDAARHKPTPTK